MTEAPYTHVHAHTHTHTHTHTHWIVKGLYIIDIENATFIVYAFWLCCVFCRVLVL